MAQTESTRINQVDVKTIAVNSEESGNLGLTNTMLVERQKKITQTDSILKQGNTVVHYVLNPGELHNDHPHWHHAYLIVLILAAFISMFIGPVVFGMLATFGGIGAPILLSVVGGIVGTFAGLTFGVVFAVVCIVGLVKGVGWIANEVLMILIVGGKDLVGYAKESARKFASPEGIHRY